ncbi:Asx homology domain-domain-containing protein [Aspergillus taichungensis]|uniref:Asx homology domain-domain-containing protein n=1 Tax=Aspergillus taichungensis TaxID=482145 RepID=A0A2J5I147_9EURO|nr:Asx homology domain-domain-containing protein [Aspergillus taichungensis]
MPSTKQKPKRNPRRAVKDKWAEHHLMTSAQSPLVNIDIVKLLAKPDAWNCLDENEKEEILNLLPEDTHPNRYPSADDPDAKIPPLPESFLRYSNEWRDGIRQFQSDLEDGRYDPAWIRQAEAAVEERAAGKFDKFKEEEFEQFWGQKQKMDRSIAAGQSSQVKLSTLVEHGVVRKGDVWRYSRSFSRGRNRVLLEKEVKIVAIDGPRLTFLMPPGQRTFLSSVSSSPPLVSKEADGLPIPSASEPASQQSGPKETDGEVPIAADESSNSVTCQKRKSETEVQSTKRGRGRPSKNPLNSEDVNSEDVPKPKDIAPGDPSAMAGDFIPTPQTDRETQGTANSIENQEPETTDEKPSSQPSSETKPEGPPEGTDEIIVPDIQGLTALGTKIIEVDGRIKEIPNGNAWKEFRSYRNNQDMGSLWEVRQAWFLKTQ